MKMSEKVNIPIVKDIMTANIIALGADHNPLEAVSLFNEFKVSAVPVVSEGNESKIVGFLSEADCLKWISNCLFHDDRSSCNVKDVMSSQVKFANEAWDIFELEKFFENEGLRHAPVENANGNLVGVVSRRDILNRMEKMGDDLFEKRQSRKKPIHLSMTQELQLELGAR